MSLYPASGFFLQSYPSDDADHGNFEVVIPALRGVGVLHYWRDNESGSYAWVGPNLVETGVQVSGVSLAASDWRAVQDNPQGNLELLVRPADPGPDEVVHEWRENGGGWRWHGPFALGFDRGIAAPALAIEHHEPLQVGDHGKGSFHVVVPSRDGGFETYRNGQSSFWGASLYARGPELQGVALLLSSVHAEALFGVPNVYGDRVVAAVTRSGNLVLFLLWGGTYITAQEWTGPYSFGTDVLAGVAGNQFHGRPSLILSSYGYDESSGLPFDKDHHGNYELFVPLRTGGIAHFYKENGPHPSTAGGDDHITAGWHGYATVGTDPYDEVSAIQSSFGEDDGHLELVARRVGRPGFDFYWRDDDLVTWHGPTHVE